MIQEMLGMASPDVGAERCWEEGCQEEARLWFLLTARRAAPVPRTKQPVSEGFWARFPLGPGAWKVTGLGPVRPCHCHIPRRLFG